MPFCRRNTINRVEKGDFIFKIFFIDYFFTQQPRNLLIYFSLGSISQHQRAAGGSWEAGPVSARDVWRHPGRESAGRGLPTHSWISRGGRIKKNIFKFYTNSFRRKKYRINIRSVSINLFFYFSPIGAPQSLLRKEQPWTIRTPIQIQITRQAWLSHASTDQI